MGLILLKMGETWVYCRYWIKGPTKVLCDSELTFILSACSPETFEHNFKTLQLLSDISHDFY